MAGTLGLLLAEGVPARAYTTCSPGATSGNEICGPGTYNQGIAYSPTGDLVITVVPQTTINAQQNEAGIVVPPPATSTSAPAVSITVTVQQGATVNALNTGSYPESQNGIDLAVSGSGNIAVSNAGTIDVAKDAIHARVVDGNAVLSNTGTIIATNDGLDAGATGRGNVTIVNSGLIFGPLLGLEGVTSSGALTIINSGTLVTSETAILATSGSGTISILNSGLISAGDTEAIRTDGVQATVSNTGTIQGYVSLLAGGTFNNAGTFDARGDSSFAGGTFNNTGTFLNTAGNAPATVTLNALATFNNAGLVSMRNGRTGDQITIDGNYSGQNGRLALDVAAQSADRLVITGNATGTTTLLLSGLTPFATPFAIGPTLVTVAGQASAGAFVLDGGALSTGLVTTDLFFADGAFLLASVPSPAALAALHASLLAPLALAQAENAVVLERAEQRRSQFLHTPELRAQAGPPAPAQGLVPTAWVRGFGDYESRDARAGFTFLGRGFSYGLDSVQRSGGVLGGADLAFGAAGSGVVLGVLGGTVSSKIRFAEAGTALGLSGGIAGAYASYVRNGFFADAVFKASFLDADLELTQAGRRSTSDARLYDGLLNLGYRAEFGRLYVEPTASLEYVRSDFGDALGGVLLDGHALRGRAGARVGSGCEFGGVRLEPSVAGYVWSVLEAGHGATAYLNDAAGLTLSSDRGKPFGETQASLEVYGTGGWSGYVKGEVRFGEDLLGAGGRIGIRYAW